jgi:hypothetical protein
MSRREASKSGEKFDPKEGKWKPIGKVTLIAVYTEARPLGNEPI